MSSSRDSATDKWSLVQGVGGLSSKFLIDDAISQITFHELDTDERVFSGVVAGFCGLKFEKFMNEIWKRLSTHRLLG